MLLLVVVVGLLTSANAQIVQQCTCAEWEPCLNTGPESFQQCADKCQNHITAMGASYPAVRQCILSHLPMIETAINCTERSIGTACAPTAGYQVPKRYPETMQFAAFREINSMLKASGIGSEASGLLHVGRKGAGCMMKCIHSSGGGCLKRLNCGLALPSDNVMIATVKQCAIGAGFDTNTVRQICSCIANAGIRNSASAATLTTENYLQLTNICPRLIVS